MVNIFQYLENNKGRQIPLKFKLINNLPLNENDLYVYGCLNLSHTNISSLPDNLIVNGDVLLFNSNISSLPDNLTVHGDLYTTKIKLQSLPNNLIVNGDLGLSHTKISKLPNNLTVKGDLFCYDTPLAINIKNDVSLLKKYKKQIKGNLFYK